MHTSVKCLLSFASAVWMGSVLCMPARPVPSVRPSPPPPKPANTEQQIIALERQFVVAEQNKNLGEMRRLLSSDCQIVGSDGKAYSKAQLLEIIQDEPSVQLSAFGLRVQMQGKDVASVSYSLDVTQDAGKGQEVRHLFVKSHWKYDSSVKDWRIVFRQTTPAGD
jgi:hypothetical protein